MPKAKDNPLTTLAGLIVALEEKRAALAEMKHMAGELQRGGLIAAAGEAALIRRLEERQAAALESLRKLGGDSADGAVLLGELRAALDGSEWAAARPVHEELKRKTRKHQDLLDRYLKQLDHWRREMEELEKDLVEALAAKAPVLDEQNAAQRFKDSIKTAERLLGEQKHRLFVEKLDQLGDASAAVPPLRATVREEITRTEPIARQADLLLIQSPIDEQQRRYDYTVLLRTASGPGSQGINIQDSSTLVERDRTELRAIIGRVTDAIVGGLAREFALRKAAAAPAPAPAADGAGAEDVARHLRPDDGGGVVEPGELNVLLQDMGDLMFRLFMPDWLQRYLHETRCSVMITTNDLELPWELMFCGDKFLCLDRATSRMPMGRTLPPERSASGAPPGRTLRFLLIYSDPEQTLPAAGAEIALLSAQLKEDWGKRIEVVTLSREEATGERLNRELRRGSFDVIHYAGHAAFDERSPDLSGLLVSDGGKGKEIFFAQKVRRLLKGRPLVFLNACQSGAAANENTAPRTDYLLKPAEGLASAFLYGGALACIGSLWPIYDRPAAEFAIEFYRHALKGKMLGEAMRRARVATRDNHPNQITWAAFALYGDATFRL